MVLVLYGGINYLERLSNGSTLTLKKESVEVS